MEEDVQKNDNEIDLLIFLAILLKHKMMIIVISGISTIAVLIYSIISLILPTELSPLPNVYEPSALMLINDTNSSSGGISSLLSSSGLGGLASFTGLNIGSESTNSQLAVFLTTTNNFLDEIVDTFDLINRYKIKKTVRATSRDILKKYLKAEIDTESGVLSLKFKDKDPAFAQSVVNYSVEHLEKMFDDMGIDQNKLQKDNLEKNISNTFNEIQKLELETRVLGNSLSSYGTVQGGPSSVLEMTRLELELIAKKEVYKQLKTQYELLKVKMASETPVFQILEFAEIPDRKSGPSRGKLCIIVAFSSFLFSTFLAVLLNAIDKIKNNPVAIATFTKDGKGTK